MSSLAAEAGPEWLLSLEGSSLHPHPSSLAGRRFERVICHVCTFLEQVSGLTNVCALGHQQLPLQGRKDVVQGTYGQELGCTLKSSSEEVSLRQPRTYMPLEM